MGTVDSLSGGKVTRAWSWPLIPSTEVKNGRAVSSLHSALLIKHSENFIFCQRIYFKFCIKVGVLRSSQHFFQLLNKSCFRMMIPLSSSKSTNFWQPFAEHSLGIAQITLITSSQSTFRTHPIISARGTFGKLFSSPSLSAPLPSHHVCSTEVQWFTLFRALRRETRARNHRVPHFFREVEVCFPVSRYDSSQPLIVATYCGGPQLSATYISTHRYAIKNKQKTPWL